MAVVIRMKRTGRKNRPCYRISVTNSRNARDGRTLETLGLYDPASPVEALRLRVEPERVKFWLERGAKPSDTVASLLRKSGVEMPSQRVKPPRERPGRKKTTKTKARREERKERLTTAKTARRTERLAAKRAAAKAAAVAPAEGAS